MKTINVTEVNDCGEDGRAPARIIARFTNKTDAEAIYNPYHYTIQETSYQIYESKEDYIANNPDATHKRTLNKIINKETLTTNEFNSLNLTNG